MSLRNRLDRLERTRRPSADALPAWRILLGNRTPSAAEVSNLLAWLPLLPPLRAVARELIGSGRTSLRPADARRVLAALPPSSTPNDDDDDEGKS